MDIVYAQEQWPTSWAQSIFLAGPTSRSGGIGWRKEALALLEAEGYSGVVFVPEPRSGDFAGLDYPSQVAWERAALNAADAILFWVPRSKVGPGLTTNIEFGRYVTSGRVVFGAPPEALSVRYLEHLMATDAPGTNHMTRRNNPWSRLARLDTLAATVQAALGLIGPGMLREGGECTIPLCAYQTPAFQDWLRSQKATGNQLLEGTVEWAFFPGSKPFFTAVHVRMWIEAEQRVKENEFVLSRTDISAVVAHSPLQGLDTRVVMVQEYRSPVRNAQSMVLELPGGSSPKGDTSPTETAAHELEEEVGLQVDPSRFRILGVRQAVAPLSSHVAHLFAVELSAEEIQSIVEMEQRGDYHGVVEDTERTYPCVRTVGELLSSKQADWLTLGQVFQALVLV